VPQIQTSAPPNPAAKLISVDEDSVRDIPGLIKVFQRGNFIGLVTEREEQAIQAGGLMITV
jgi:nicotinate dehydrogenase subunit B